MKKKLSKAERSQRRLSEAQKAQLADFAASPLNRGILQTEDRSKVQQPAAVKQSEEKYKLPLTEIRKDLAKNAFFALFSIVALIVLQKTNWGFDLFKSIFRF